jgi:hypothetical protein
MEAASAPLGDMDDADGVASTETPAEDHPDNDKNIDFQSPFRRRKVFSNAKHTISAGQYAFFTLRVLIFGY